MEVSENRLMSKFLDLDGQEFTTEVKPNNTVIEGNIASVELADRIVGVIERGGSFGEMMAGKGLRATNAIAL